MKKGEIAKLNSRILSRALVGMGIEAIALLHEEGVARDDVLQTVDQLVVYGLQGRPH